MTKFLLAGAAMLAVSTAALADEPQKLSDDQLGIVAGGFNNDNNNGFGVPSTLSFFLLNIETTEVTQANVASSDQVGAAISLLGGGPAVAHLQSTITQVNTN